jgi:hypothetical protein
VNTSRSLQLTTPAHTNNTATNNPCTY